ncbi:MAG: DUF1326 domain-containing protein [Gemmatimonadetes bacterium]|nr:DUF1326 domain-containing protein [Gemmatimonadota bacterium]
MSKAEARQWWATGLLFENCCCQSVCPGHVHFDQMCTLERCVGFWVVRFDDGEYRGVALGGTAAVIAYDSPRHMIEGDWTEVIIIDDQASPEQRQAVEAILGGRAGGPWAKLAPFVSRWLETRYLPIRIDDEGTHKRVVIDGVLDGSVRDIRGRDRSKPVTFENMFNQVHATSQVIATGSATYDDGVIRVHTEGTHGLHSRFQWSVS